MTLTLTKEQARRIAVRAQLLASPRPDDLLEVIRHLGYLQVDMTSVVAPSAELVCWSRLESSPPPGAIDVLQANGDLVEHRGRLIPAEDVALLAGDMAAWPRHTQVAAWVEANDRCRRDILAFLRAEGPHAARHIEDTTDVPWRSSGWTNDKNVMKMLEVMEERGEVAVAHREGRERVWDLASRILPGDAPVPHEEAHREMARRRLLALGIARPRSLEAWKEPYEVRDVGVQARVEGVRGTWRVDPDLVSEDFEGRAAVLPARPLGVRPQAARGDLRFRLPARDVQACGQPSLGLLGDACAVRRPSGRQGRCHR